MSQSTTTSGYATNVAAAFRQVDFGVLVAWQRIVSANANFFTIGTSTIGGGDFIKSAGSFVTFFDKYVFTDYSDYVMNWSVQRRLGQYPFGMIMAQADLQLDNTSGLFLPGKDATIGSGILPNRPIKISASIGNESIMQFTGFTGQPELGINDRRLTLHAFDAMDYIQRSSITTSGTTTSGVTTTTSGYLISVRTDQAIQYMLTTLGFSTNQFVLDQGLQASIGYVSLTDRKYGDILYDLILAEMALSFVDEGGIFRFWNRQHFLTTSGVSQFSFNYDNMVDLNYENTPVINDVIVRAKPRSVQGYQVVWQLGAAQLIPGNAEISMFANFVDSYGDMPVTNVTTPSATQDTASSYSANTSATGSGTDMSGSVVLTSVYNFGKSYKMTFKNNSSTPAYITSIILMGTPAKVTSEIEQRYLDATSIETNGRNPANNGDPLIIENDYIQDSSTAYSIAYTLVNEYKTPRRRYKAEIFARPELQIGDWGRITIPDANNETKNVYIVGIQTQMQQNADLTQYVWLEERNIKSYFTIGTSTIAGTAEIAP